MLDDMTTNTDDPRHPTRTIFHPDPATIRRAIERRSVATLATVSATGRPHAATVLYQCVDDALFVSTYRDSRKARNIAEPGVAAVTIAVRRLPVGPPASIQFQSSAAVLAIDDPEIIRLAGSGPARPDHGPRRAGPRRRLLPAPRAARPASSPTRWACRCGGPSATPSTQPARSTCARQRGVRRPDIPAESVRARSQVGPGSALGVWLRRWPGVYDRYCGRHEQPASARWRGAQASGRPAQGAGRQPHGARCLDRHHASGPQRVHLLGRGCQAGDDPRAPHPTDPGGARGRPASTVLLARVQAPGAHRQVAVGFVGWHRHGHPGPNLGRARACLARARVAGAMAAHRTFNPLVLGSSPRRPTTDALLKDKGRPSLPARLSTVPIVGSENSTKRRCGG